MNASRFRSTLAAASLAEAQDAVTKLVSSHARRHQPTSVLTSSFTPGPMVEAIDTFLM